MDHLDKSNVLVYKILPGGVTIRGSDRVE